MPRLEDLDIPLSRSARKLRRLLETAEEPIRGQVLAGRLRVSRRHLRRLIGRLEDAGVPIERHEDGRHRRFSIPPAHCRTEVPVRLSPAAMRRLCELAKADDPADPESAQASAEALAALRRALRVEPGE
jgi:predicted DNA-binding transcriptional regulator YafY